MRPSCKRETESALKVENVVNEPRTPTAKNKPTGWLDRICVKNSPNIKLPKIFTKSVGESP